MPRPAKLGNGAARSLWHLSDPGLRSFEEQSFSAPNEPHRSDSPAPPPRHRCPVEGGARVDGVDLTVVDKDSAAEGLTARQQPLPGMAWPTSPSERRRDRRTQEARRLLYELRGLGLPAPPADLRCPIGGDLMLDPVTAADGITYERENMARLLRDGQRSSPVTGQPLPSTELHASDEVRQAARVHFELRREIETQWLSLRAKISEYSEQVAQRERRAAELGGCPAETPLTSRLSARREPAAPFCAAVSGVFDAANLPHGSTPPSLVDCAPVACDGATLPCGNRRARRLGCSEADTAPRPRPTLLGQRSRDKEAAAAPRPSRPPTLLEQFSGDKARFLTGVRAAFSPRPLKQQLHVPKSAGGATSQ